MRGYDMDPYSWVALSKLWVQNLNLKTYFKNNTIHQTSVVECGFILHFNKSDIA